MKLEFLKIKKENIFCEDFNSMTDNNVINFDNTNINILYAPNGVGKSSLCKVLDDKGEFILNYDDKEYSHVSSISVCFLTMISDFLCFFK